MSHPFLKVVPDVAPSGPDALFCGACGRPPLDDAPQARVCERCHMGVVLSAAADLAPAAGEPFLIVDRALAVCAVSHGAERLLGVDEPEAVNRILTEFLVPADAEPSAQHNLLALAASAAGGLDGTARAVVRPAGEFGVFLEARIGPCGPPPGALVVLSDIA